MHPWIVMFQPLYVVKTNTQNEIKKYIYKAALNNWLSLNHTRQQARIKWFIVYRNVKKKQKKTASLSWWIFKQQIL